MHVQKWRCLAWSAGGVFGPLTSNSHSSDTCASLVLGSVVPTSLNQPKLDKSWLQVPEKQLKPHYYSDTYVRGIIHRRWLRTYYTFFVKLEGYAIWNKIIKVNLLSQGRLQVEGFLNKLFSYLLFYKTGSGISISHQFLLNLWSMFSIPAIFWTFLYLEGRGMTTTLATSCLQGA